MNPTKTFHIYHNLPSRCKAGYPSAERSTIEATSLAAAIAIAILGQPHFGHRFGGRVVCDGVDVYTF